MLLLLHQAKGESQRERRTLITQLAKKPGQIVQIDIYGPLPESEAGNIYLLTYMDT